MAARELRPLPVAAALVVALAASAAAQHPGRHLESARASAPLVYLGTVAAVEDTGISDMPEPTVQHARASVVVDRVFRPASAETPAASVTVRYERATRGPQEGQSRMAYSIAAGDRAVVFASSFEPAYPIEMITGKTKVVAEEVKALRVSLDAMDEAAANLHGVTPAVKGQQLALYDRILAELAKPARP